MRYRLAVFFLISSTVYIVGQPITKPAYPTKEAKSGNIAEYERLVKHYRYLKPDSATYFAQKGMTIARQQKDSIGVAMMLVQLGMIDDNQGKFDESGSKYQRALAIYKKGGSVKGTATVTIRIGVVDLRNGNYDKAIGHFIQALNYAESIRDTFGMMEANYSISWAHLDQHQYGQALHYLIIAEQLNQRLGFSNISLNIYNNFGILYREKKEYEKAKRYLEKGISLSKSPEYQGLNITLINNLATVYAQEGLTEKAIALQEEALFRSREIHNYLRELQSLYGLAKTYGEANPDKAIFYLRQAVLLAREKKAHRQEMRYLKEITILYKSQGNYKEALFMKEREHALADSFFYKDMSERIKTLQSDYELSKSRSRVNELTYLNNRNRLELENSTLLRNVTFVGIILLLVILGLVYNQNRIKHQKTKEISEKNKSLQLLVEEKEWLLKEIHHRVKNNLQIISSMLNAQTEFLHDPTALMAIRDSQNRVHTMALIHQKLYQSQTLALVNMQAYIQDIVDYLIESFDRQQSVYQTIIVSDLELDVTLATPLGLIINEAVTNSLKYAFPINRPGLITISLHPIGEQAYGLTITDDGIGLSPDFDIIRSNTLGLTMIRGLSKQIGGQLQIHQQSGVQINLQFSLPKSAKPV